MSRLSDDPRDAPRRVACPAFLTMSGDLRLPPTPTTTVGDEPVASGGWASVVPVRFYDGTWSSGTLIDQETVLTAAHCLMRSRVSSVDFGEELDSSEGRFVPAPAAGTHLNYCETEQWGHAAFDYGFVELAEAVDVSPMSLLITQEQWDAAIGDDAPVTLVEFGATEEAGNALDGREREVETSIVAFTPEAMRFRAGGEGEDSCK